MAFIGFNLFYLNVYINFFEYTRKYSSNVVKHYVLPEYTSKLCSMHPILGFSKPSPKKTRWNKTRDRPCVVSAVRELTGTTCAGGEGRQIADVAAGTAVEHDGLAPRTAVLTRLKYCILQSRKNSLSIAVRSNW